MPCRLERLDSRFHGNDSAFAGMTVLSRGWATKVAFSFPAGREGNNLPFRLIGKSKQDQYNWKNSLKQDILL
ncbi:MAG: hypothetical protein F4X95_01440 [Oligoflexia bacterium]|nr:hypothetical protein [Oligoflexia bacterium]